MNDAMTPESSSPRATTRPRRVLRAAGASIACASALTAWAQQVPMPGTAQVPRAGTLLNEQP
ncbi:hypothetical protein, partial [Caballeronia glebae]|uniref:hypothetical protein n=1 Tax=Caballeronia glebae TaxID=1777143 RepID=UPI000A8DBB2A